MDLTFLGTSACRFDTGDDTVHYLVNESVLVDTGWFAVSNLRDFGIDPLAVRHLLFTHLHHDHYLGLPGFLFHLYCHGNAGRTTVYGPAADVRLVVDLAEALLQKERFYADTAATPVVELADFGEISMDCVRVSYIRAPHPVDARSYVFSDDSGARLGITGDTDYNPALGEFFRGCEVIVHEASMGACAAASTRNTALHAGAADAARVAQAARAKRLFLVHGSRESREASIEAARSEFNGEVAWPEPGLKITI